MTRRTAPIRTVAVGQPTALAGLARLIWQHWQQKQAQQGIRPVETKTAQGGPASTLNGAAT